MTDIAPDQYEDFAFTVACIVWSICHHPLAETSGFYHGNSNHLEKPCDMLARLGLMHTAERGYTHLFVPGWSPASPGRIQRHPGEPRGSDLVLALRFYATRFPDAAAGAPVTAPEPMPSPELPGGDRITPESEAFMAWAMRRAAAQLAGLGLGTWDGDTKFLLSPPLDLHHDMEEYTLSRWEVLEEVGGDERRLFPENYPYEVVRS